MECDFDLKSRDDWLICVLVIMTNQLKVGKARCAVRLSQRDEPTKTVERPAQVDG
jgi:hypothetical protein